MRAFVLSGGGNRGALQVGALRALLTRGIQPEMIVGCSVGALNAAFLARNQSMTQIDTLLDVWRRTTQEDVYPGSRLSVLWRFLTGKDSLYDNRNFYAHLQRSGTTPALTFGAVPGNVPLYITATDLDSGELHVFGDQPRDRVLDAVMASTALPPLHPPWSVDGRRYIDGGTVTPLPLRVAIERGATEIYALHIWEEPRPMSNLQRGVAAIINRSISTMLRLQTQHDLLLVEVSRQIRLHEIRLWTSEMPDLNDWSQADRLHEAGYQLTQQYLDQILPASRPQNAPISRFGRLRRLVQEQWNSWLPRREEGGAPATVAAKVEPFHSGSVRQ